MTTERNEIFLRDQRCQNGVGDTDSLRSFGYALHFDTANCPRRFHGIINITDITEFKYLGCSLSVHGMNKDLEENVHKYNKLAL
jgi:hypothetical protein